MQLAERVCQDQSARGFRLSIATSHPAVIAYCRASPKWRPLGIKRLGGTRQQLAGRPVTGSTGRGLASFEWTASRGRREEDRGRESLASLVFHAERSQPPKTPVPLRWRSG
jgi:hypothetical protein